MHAHQFSFLRKRIMNSDDLELFATVVRNKSISRAALELGVDQSTITRQISRLEQDLDMRLLHRSGRGVALTEAGAAILPAAMKVCDAIDNVKQAAHALTHTGPQQLVIGAPPTIASALFTRLVLALRQRYPDTALRLVEGLSSQMLNQLSDGQIDLGIVYASEQGTVLHYDEVLREQLYIVGPVQAKPLASPCPASALKDLPFILPSTPHGLRKIAESVSRHTGMPLNVLVESDGSIETIKRLVRAGVGYAIMPYVSIEEEVRLGLLQAALVCDPPLHRSIAIAIARNRPPMADLWHITQLVKSCMENLVTQDAWRGVERA